tara:strand:+ start:355 stop:576 length:222 start_codon:yes stop_codon:yes gene_type:complete
MDYKFLATVNFFELQRVESLLITNGVRPKIRDSYNFNLNAGWVDPFCNSNERTILVLKKDFQLAKKILENLYN